MEDFKHLKLTAHAGFTQNQIVEKKELIEADLEEILGQPLTYKELEGIINKLAQEMMRKADLVDGIVEGSYYQFLHYIHTKLNVIKVGLGTEHLELADGQLTKIDLRVLLVLFILAAKKLESEVNGAKNGIQLQYMQSFSKILGEQSKATRVMQYIRWRSLQHGEVERVEDNVVQNLQQKFQLPDIDLMDLDQDGVIDAAMRELMSHLENV